MKRTYTLTNTFNTEKFGGTTDFSEEHAEYFHNELEVYSNEDRRITGITIDCSDHYIKHFSKKDMKMYVEYPGYSFVISKSDYKDNLCPVCSVLLKDDTGNFLINTGVIDAISYRIIYKDNGDIVINTSEPFDGTCIIEAPEIYGAKIYFEKDSWISDGAVYKLQISTLKLGIKMIYCSDILLKGDNCYIKNYGIFDDIDYTVNQDNNNTLTISSSKPFDGLLIIRGDVHIYPATHIT